MDVPQAARAVVVLERGDPDLVVVVVEVLDQHLPVPAEDLFVGRAGGRLRADVVRGVGADPRDQLIAGRRRRADGVRRDLPGVGVSGVVLVGVHVQLALARLDAFHAHLYGVAARHAEARAQELVVSGTGSGDAVARAARERAGLLDDVHPGDLVGADRRDVQIPRVDRAVLVDA